MKNMVLFLLVFLAFALWLAVSFGVRDMFRAYTPNNVAETTVAGHVGEEQKRKVGCKEPPSFSGEQDMFSEWLFSIEKSIKALKPDDAVAFVGSYLEGDAKKWFMNLCTDRKMPASWNLFKEQLISAFKSEHDDEQNRLLLSSYASRATLETYITDCFLAKDVDELAKSALCVTGLSDSQVKRDVRRAHPKTLQDAIRAARTSYEDFTSRYACSFLKCSWWKASSVEKEGHTAFSRGKTSLNARRTVFFGVESWATAQSIVHLSKDRHPFHLFLIL